MAYDMHKNPCQLLKLLQKGNQRGYSELEEFLMMMLLIERMAKEMRRRCLHESRI